MVEEYLNLPGDCFVNEITNNPEGITLSAELLTAFGFHHQQSATFLITKGHIVITTHPNQCNIMEAIQELQLRQDELKQDFAPAILALVKMFKQS